MPVIINGSTGVSGVDGSAGTPAVQGTDTNTGMFFPAADTIAFAEGGVEAMRLDASGNVGIGVAAPGYRLDVRDASNTTVHVMANTSGVRVGASADTPVTGAGFVGTYSNHPLTLGTNNAERVRITAGGDFQFNSGYGSVATAFGCRAWVNFNGTGTVAIRGSGNVSSITDNNTGDYTVNFTTAMPDANYNTVGMSGSNNAATNGSGFSVSVAMNNASPFQYSASGVRVFTGVSNAAPSDNAYVLVSIFR